MKLFDFFSSGHGTASEAINTVSLDRQINTATVPLAKTPLIPEEDPVRAYLTDKDDNVYMIDRFPFMIGRKKAGEGTDLSLPHIAEISGIHASVVFEDGRYYICDHDSTNGTFIKRDDRDPFSCECRVKKEELFDGSIFFLYRTEFTFHLDSRSSQTCLITSQNAATIMLDDEEDELSEYEAYLETDSGMIPVAGDSFSSYGLHIERSYAKNQIKYIISAEAELMIEGEPLSPGNKAELFSGCHFLMGNRFFRFFIR